MGTKSRIAGFDVSVDHIRTVHEQKPSQNLVHEILNMLIAEILPGVDHSM